MVYAPTYCVYWFIVGYEWHDSTSHPGMDPSLAAFEMEL